MLKIRDSGDWPTPPVEVHMDNKQEADTWLPRVDWEMVGKHFRFMTIGHGGRQLRIWVGEWNGFCSHEGGHFDTDDRTKWFDINCDDVEVIDYVLNEIRHRIKRDTVTFTIDCRQNFVSRGSLAMPCQIILPYQ